MMRLREYLDRIRYRGTPRPDLGALVGLQEKHVCAVPFENLDIQLGRRVTISPEDAYEKIVINGRGGWCYEQNGLLGWALSEIGFDVTRTAGAVMRQDTGDAALANHLCLLVSTPEAPGKYLVDVGFGGSMNKPIVLAELQHGQPPFRLGLKKLDDGYWRFWEDLGDGKFSFDFVEEAADETMLDAKSVSLQSDPSSSSVLNLVAQLRSQERHIVLRGRVLRTASTKGISKRTLESADELVVTLASQFGLDVPEVANLWPRITARHEKILRAKSDVRGG